MTDSSPMQTRHLPLARPYFSERARAAITARIDTVLQSGHLLLGPNLRELEANFAVATRRHHCVGVNTGTTALTISLRYFDVAGKAVLVPSGSFVTDVTAIIEAGGRPVLVDMDPQTLALNVDDAERKLTADTVGMIWVHLTGIISSAHRRIEAFAARNNLFLIEDASHAHGAEIDGRLAGNFGDASIFSLYATKLVTAGTGGILATDDERLKVFAEQLRSFGKDPVSGDVTLLGNDGLLDEIGASVALEHLRELPKRLSHNRQIAATYNRYLSGSNQLQVLASPPGAYPAYYQYVVLLAEGVNRDAIRQRMKQEAGVDTKGIYVPTHREPLLRHLDTKDLHQTEATLDRSLCLPIHASVTEDDAAYVAQSLLKILSGAA